MGRTVRLWVRAVTLWVRVVAAIGQTGLFRADTRILTKATQSLDGCERSVWILSRSGLREVHQRLQPDSEYDERHKP